MLLGEFGSFVSPKNVHIPLPPPPAPTKNSFGRHWWKKLSTKQKQVKQKIKVTLKKLEQKLTFMHENWRDHQQFWKIGNPKNPQFVLVKKS